MSKIFIVYMMANRKNGAIYIGVSSDPVGRVWQHRNEFFEGFTKRYGLKKLVWYEVHDSAEFAVRRERQLKEWRRPWKIELIEAMNPDWRDLWFDLIGARS